MAVAPKAARRRRRLLARGWRQLLRARWRDGLHELPRADGEQPLQGRRAHAGADGRLQRRGSHQIITDGYGSRRRLLRSQRAQDDLHRRRDDRDAGVDRAGERMLRGGLRRVAGNPPLERHPTPDEQAAIVVYLRSLTPAPQNGSSNFGNKGGYDGGTHHHDGGFGPPGGRRLRDPRTAAAPRAPTPPVNSPRP